MNYLKNLFLFAFCMCTLAVPAELSGNSAKVLNSAVTGPSQDSSLQVQVINKFPQGIEFEINSPRLSLFTDVKVTYQVKGQGNKTGYRTQQVAGADSLTITVDSQRAGTYIPPGTTISYYVEAWGENTAKVKTEQKDFLYLDPNFEWRNITSDWLTIYYHDQTSTKNADSALLAAQETADFALPIFNHTPQEQFHLVLYTSYRDMEKILPFRSSATAENLMTQGMAFTEERTAVIYAGSRSLMSTTSHEFMHLLLHDAVGRFHTRLPAWLDEGLAEFGNQYAANDYANPLQRAVESGTDKHIKFLNTFSGTPEEIIAAYGKGNAIVIYLASEFGVNSFADLISNFRTSLSNEQAFQRTYGMTLDEIELGWKESFGTESKKPIITPPTSQPEDKTERSMTTTVSGSCVPSKERPPADLATIFVFLAPLLILWRNTI